MEELDQMEAVKRMLTQWVTAVKLSNAVSFTDINRISENLALRLLNAVYDYRLENLNWDSSDYLAVDLGESGGGDGNIAFQVTATASVEKIKSTLEKFHAKNGPHKLFPGGVYFFFINEKSPSISPSMKTKLEEIDPLFDPASRLISIPMLLKKIEKLYSTDPGRFAMVKGLLDKEFGFGKGKTDRGKLLEELFMGSKRYLADLRGSGGRFCHLDISDIILQKPSKKEWLYSTIIKNLWGPGAVFQKSPWPPEARCWTSSPCCGKREINMQWSKVTAGWGKQCP
jgi:hypothetical protein